MKVITDVEERDFAWDSRKKEWRHERIYTERILLCAHTWRQLNASSP